MPTSPLGLAIFVLLLAPGLTYVILRELRTPTRTASAFRETASIAFASVIFDALALAIFAAVRVFAPRITPDLGRLIRETEPYIDLHYRSLILWAVLLLIGASSLAAVFGYFTPAWAKRFTNGISFYSAWWNVVRGDEVPKGHTVLAGCELLDGSYISGEVLTASTEIEETQNRDLVLRPPILYRPVGAIELTELEASVLVLSAHQVKFLTFTYVPVPEPAPNTATSTA